MAFLHASKIPFATWWNFFPVRASVLVGWAGGPSAQTLIGKGDSQILAQALTTLHQFTAISSAKLESMIEKFWVADWQTDPFARGAYSYVPVGAIDAATELANPIDGTLFFAGEATDDDSFGGTVESAITTGHRAAREALAATKK